VPVALEPFGRTDWTGKEAAFKSFALAGDPTEGGKLGPTAIGGNLQTTDCPEANGIISPLGPGASTRATFRLDASAGPDLKTLPGPVAFRVWVPYTTQQPPVTMPPAPTMCPCARWEPTLQEIAVRGMVLPDDATPPMVSIGEVVDAAIANARFRAFIEDHDVEQCSVTMTLPPDQGRYLPHAAGWDLEVSCLKPRRFARIEIDPWTARVNGTDICTVACWR
jgi:hypothetical protein